MILLAKVLAEWSGSRGAQAEETKGGGGGQALSSDRKCLAGSQVTETPQAADEAPKSAERKRGMVEKAEDEASGLGPAAQDICMSLGQDKPLAESVAAPEAKEEDEESQIIR